MKKKLFENVGGNNFKLSEMRDIYGISHAYDDITPGDNPYTNLGTGTDPDWDKIDKERKIQSKKDYAIQKFLDKNGEKIRSVYDKYATEDLKKDADVKNFIEFYDKYRRNKPEASGVPINKSFFKSYVKGISKIVALKRQSTADKISAFFKNLF